MDLTTDDCRIPFYNNQIFVKATRISWSKGFFFEKCLKNLNFWINFIYLKKMNNQLQPNNNNNQFSRIISGEDQINIAITWTLKISNSRETIVRKSRRNKRKKIICWISKKLSNCQKKLVLNFFFLLFLSILNRIINKNWMFFSTKTRILKIQS